MEIKGNNGMKWVNMTVFDPHFHYSNWFSDFNTLHLQA